MLEYVIVTFSAIAYRVTRGSPELVSFSSHFSPSSSNCLWSFKMARFLRSVRDLEKQLTFQKGFKEHDNSVLPEHILWMLEYFC